MPQSIPNPDPTATARAHLFSIYRDLKDVHTRQVELEDRRIDAIYYAGMDGMTANEVAAHLVIPIEVVEREFHMRHVPHAC